MGDQNKNRSLTAIMLEVMKNNDDVRSFLETARNQQPITDKVTTHSYHLMYGMFLLPFYKKKPKMKMLEIGLGCDMNYGPGASVQVWKKLFRKAELWEAEYDKKCVDKSKKEGKLKRINTLTGDQGDPKILHDWIEKSGGKFDIVIDDGGHQNCQIWNSFVKLWPEVNSGGLYFIEDMQVARNRNYNEYHHEPCPESTIVPDKLIKETVDNLIYNRVGGDVAFLFCQSEACVLGKK